MTKGPADSRWWSRTVTSGEGSGGDGFRVSFGLVKEMVAGVRLSSRPVEGIGGWSGMRDSAWFGSVEHRMTDKPGRRACAVVLAIGSASGDQPADLGNGTGARGLSRRW
jgi:hypothetical protein